MQEIEICQDIWKRPILYEIYKKAGTENLIIMALK